MMMVMVTMMKTVIMLAACIWWKLEFCVANNTYKDFNDCNNIACSAYMLCEQSLIHHSNGGWNNKLNTKQAEKKLKNKSFN